MYENPQQPEDINVSDDRPLRDFFSLLFMLLLIVTVSVAALSVSAQWLARYIPFSTEQRIANGFSDRLGVLQEHDSSNATLEIRERQMYLQQLSKRLQTHMDLPDDMNITVHYTTDETVNAYATLGGHVVMFAGLVNKLPHENALAMVLAHEIAHVELRHPIVAMSRGLTISIALGSVFGLTDNAAVARVVEWFGITSILTFSRGQERAADHLAAQALISEYGHLNGSADLFRVFADEAGENTDSANPDRSRGLPEFHATHPALAERIEELRSKMHELGRSGPVTALPWH